MDTRRLLIIGGIAVGVGMLICCCLFIVLTASGGLMVFGLTQPATTTGNAFMTSLRDGDYAGAYDLCTPGLQEELGSVVGLRTTIVDNDVEPASWTFNSTRIENDGAELEGTLVLAGERKGTVDLVLTNVGGAWKVDGFHLKEE